MEYLEKSRLWSVNISRVIMLVLLSTEHCCLLCYASIIIEMFLRLNKLEFLFKKKEEKKFFSHDLD